MAKFQKKPVVIEAFQWTTDVNQKEDPQWLARRLGGSVRIEGVGTPEVCMKIDILEGTMTASPGDWIIQGVSGELYPCKPDIFELTYESVPE